MYVCMYVYVCVCVCISERNSVNIKRSNLTCENSFAFFEMWSNKTILQSDFYCSNFMNNH